MAKVQIDLKARDKASPKIKGMTGALVGAQLATTAIIGATKKLVEVGKKAIENFHKQEKAERLLEAQLGRNIDGLKQFASEMQGITTVGDETTLEIIRLNSAMGVSDDRLQEATKNTIALAKGFNIAETTAVKMAAAIESGNTAMLSKYIPALKTAGSEAEKNVIIQEALAKGFKVAQEEALTFSGRLQQLKNVQGDNLEKFGEFASILGEDIVKSLSDSAIALNEFLNDSDKMSTILGNASASLAVVKDIFATLKPVVEDVASVLKDDILEAFGDLNSDGGETVDVFKLLAGATKQLSIGLTIIGASAGTAIQGFVNLVQAAQASFEAIKTVYDWYNDPDNVSMGDVVDGFKNAGKAFGEFGSELVADAKVIVNDAIDAYKKFPDEVEAMSIEMSETFQSEYDRMVEKVVNKSKSMTDDLGDNKKDDTDTTVEELAEQEKAYEQLFKSIASASAKSFDEMQKMLGSMFSASAEKITSVYESQKNAQITAINDVLQAQLSAIGMQEMTQEESLQRELESLQVKLGQMRNVRDKAIVQEEINEKNKELKKVKLTEDAAKKKETAEKNFLNKKNQMDEAAFNANKAMQISNIWISTAAGIAGAWAQSIAQLGPIGGSIAASVLTATLLATAGVQTAAASQQTFKPAQFAVGTSSAPGGMALVGERGPELVTLPQGASVNTANDTEGILDNMATIHIESMTVVADNPTQFNEQMIELRRTQLARV